MAEKATITINVIDGVSGYSLFEDAGLHVEDAEGEVIEVYNSDEKFKVDANLEQILIITANCPGYEEQTENFGVSGDETVTIALIKAPGPTPGSKYVTEKGDLFPHKLSSELIVKY